MAQQLLELDTDDGGTILVAVDVSESAVGQVATPGEPPIKKLDRSFNIIQALIVRGCRPLTKAFKQLHQETQATDAEVEFGINFTTKGNVYLVESSGTATLKVKVSWKMDQQKR
ncbi:MAG: CU044_2847 family protein [Coleofasciculus sp. D1-CHI-01]|uniref:CU044_2847 family protein n=1 Tax=Coleofasciculus sp. D1-CHI-01 TaxID=3068482 RepID=UPI0033022891